MTRSTRRITSRSRPRSWSFGSVGIAVLAAASAAHAQSKPEEIETLYVSDQYSYDDNLFRQSEASSASDLQEGRIQSREDYVNRLTAGIGEDFEIGRQVFSFQGRAQDVRFSENDHLDHVAGHGRVNWDWLITSALTGDIGARYNRSLADFANSRDTRKDMLETIVYEGSIRYKLGPRWSVFAGAQHTNTEHGLQERSIDDFEADSGRAGIQYTTPSQHSLAFEYRYLDAHFPNQMIDETQSLQAGDYEENAAFGRFVYTFSVHTQLQASYGYVEREHSNAARDRFSGDVWRAELAWQPRPKFSTRLAAWRELRAHADAESDYFISDGFSITPTWSPIRQISLSLEAMWEDQEYLGFNPIDEATTPGRLDDVFSGLATFVYSPRENIELQLSYRALERDSNRDVRSYDAEVAAAQIRWRIL